MRGASVSPCSSLRRRELLPLGLVLVLSLLCSACLSGRKPAQPVRGQLLVDGQPAAQAQVLFHSAEGSSDDPRPTGQTDDQGYFHLTSYVNGDGAPVGDYLVTVTWFRVYGGNGQEVVRYNALPQHYADPKNSQLRVSIAKGNNELTPLQLYSR
jgi:hypothetical protein